MIMRCKFKGLLRIMWAILNRLGLLNAELLCKFEVAQ